MAETSMLYIKVSPNYLYCGATLFTMNLERLAISVPGQPHPGFKKKCYNFFKREIATDCKWMGEGKVFPFPWSLTRVQVWGELRRFPINERKHHPAIFPKQKNLPNVVIQDVSSTISFTQLRSIFNSPIVIISLKNTKRARWSSAKSSLQPTNHGEALSNT